MLTETQIERNISWLLKNASVPVRYLTRRYILKEDIHSPQMLDLRKQVEVVPYAQKIFAKSKEGIWTSRRQVWQSALKPTFVGTVWQLMLLGDMGFNVSDPRIAKACEYALEFQAPSGGFSRYKSYFKGRRHHADPCDTSVYLCGLGSVGMSSDSRVKKAYKLLVKMQREDGGWVRESCLRRFGWTRSCPEPTYWSALALYYSKLSEQKDSLVGALNWLVWHLSTKKEGEIRRFLYRGHNMVKELLMFSECGVDMTQKPIQVLLHWLITMYDKDESFFRYRGKPPSKFKVAEDGGISSTVARYRLKHVIEDDWLTYYMTRIFKNMLF